MERLLTPGECGMIAGALEDATKSWQREAVEVVKQLSRQIGNVELDREDPRVKVLAALEPSVARFIDHARIYGNLEMLFRRYTFTMQSNGLIIPEQA